MSKMLFADLLIKKDGLIKGPFGGDIKKSLFVPKSDEAYKVYEQGVVLKNDINHGSYYISKIHFESKLKRFEVKKGDLLMTGAGTLGEILTVPENAPKGVINQALLRIRLNESVISSSFFKYYFKYYIKAIISRINGDSVIPNLPPLPLIRETEVDIPNITTQNKIASVLSSLDSKIAINNRINAELEAMAKTIYDYWFVQFDFPFDFAQGKPSAEGKPYKSSGGKMVWNEELKSEVPEGWEVGELKDVANFTTGKLDSNAEVINAKYPFYTCAAEPTTTDTYAYDDSVILIAGNNASGNFHINRYKGKFNAYQRTYIVTAKELIDLEYIYQVLNTETKLLKTQGKGSQTKFLTIGMLTGIKVIRHKELMKLFHEMVNPMYERQEVLKQENQQLSSLRDWLLPMLMNGQVKV